MSNVTTLQSNYNIITNNNLTIDDILETINNLPEAGSGEEDLTTVLANHDTAITTQETTIDQIVTALEGKAAGSTEDLSTELTEQDTLLTSQTSKLSSVLTALEGKASGSGLSGENVTLTINYTIDSTRHGYLTYMYYSSTQNLRGDYKLITSSSGTSISISVAKGSYVHVVPSLATTTNLTMSNSTLSTTNINDASNAITIQVNETGSFSVSIEETSSSGGGSNN